MELRHRRVSLRPVLGLDAPCAAESTCITCVACICMTHHYGVSTYTSLLVCKALTHKRKGNHNLVWALPMDGGMPRHKCRFRAPTKSIPRPEIHHDASVLFRFVRLPTALCVYCG